MGMDSEQISGTLAVFGSIFTFKALTYFPPVENFIQQNAIWVVILALLIVVFHNKLGRWIKEKLI